MLLRLQKVKYILSAIIFENHIINHDFLSVFKWGLPTSTSIFSAISASIFKISVPIIKRRSSGFRNTPRSHLSDEYWPRKQQKTKWQPKLNIKNILGKIYLLQSTITWLQIHQIEQVGVFWNCQDLLLKMGTEIFQINASWAE